MPSADELDARRRIVAAIDDESDRDAVLAVFARVDWRRHVEALQLDDADDLGPLYRRCDDPDCDVAYAYAETSHYHHVGKALRE